MILAQTHFVSSSPIPLTLPWVYDTISAYKNASELAATCPFFVLSRGRSSKSGPAPPPPLALASPPPKDSIDDVADVEEAPLFDPPPVSDVVRDRKLVGDDRDDTAENRLRDEVDWEGKEETGGGEMGYEEEEGLLEDAIACVSSGYKG